MIPALLLVCAALVQDPTRPDAPDPARVKAAVAELQEAFSKGEAGARVRAIEGAAGFADAEVVEWIGRGLRDKDVLVQKAAIEALRFSAHSDALKPLHARAKLDAAKQDLATYAALMRAIGQHGHPSSIAILSDGVWSTRDAAVLEARVLSLGRIRTKDSVKALIDLMEVAGRGKIQPFMADFRLALCALTGIDQGTSQDLWAGWWREHKDGLKIATVEPELPKGLQRRWQRYWARPGEDDGAGGGEGDEPRPRRKDRKEPGG